MDSLFSIASALMGALLFSSFGGVDGGVSDWFELTLGTPAGVVFSSTFFGRWCSGSAGSSAKAARGVDEVGLDIVVVFRGCWRGKATLR